MSKIGELLREIRGTDSLRKASEKTGLNHGFIGYLEKGLSSLGKPLKPSPETLKAYSEGYGYPYNPLLVAAGYIDEYDHFKRVEDDPRAYRILELFKGLPENKKELLLEYIETLSE